MTTVLIPSAETRAFDFLRANPTFDGRGIIVGVMDTGVDPADGLLTTSYGTPKIVDSVDCTGTGDVSMTALARLDATGALVALSGRTVSLPHTMANPTGEFRLGSKPAYEFLPSGLVERMRTERRKDFDEAHKALVATAEAALAAHLASASSPAAETTSELRARVAQLTELANEYEDVGPMFDCVAYHDGARWRAAVDTACTGDLSLATQWLTTYRDEPGVFGSMGPRWLCNYTLNISADGTRLSLVVCSGAHGTHVAGIIGAHFPDAPERCGVAPGCQIVNLRIGDGRLSSMETGVAIVRAAEAAVAAGCHVVNMSFGESTAVANTGAVVDALRALVCEHGVTFIASAGNEGPGLSTVGAPGGTSSFAIGVGAYVSPAMAASQYALRERVPETMFTWSSCGPTADGDAGVTVVCPGGAIAPVPTYLLVAKEQMNGTSMSSPECAGCVALVLSGLLATGVRLPLPAMVKRALSNTARKLAGVSTFVQGAGLVQVDAAYALLRRWLTEGGPDAAAGAVSARELDYSVAVGAARARGVYLRNLDEVRRPFETVVALAPVFGDKVASAARTAFELQLALRPSAAWVRVADSLFLAGEERMLSVSVAAHTLEPGVHSASIDAFDTRSNGDDGPLFSVPITVVVPRDLSGSQGRYAESGVTALKFTPNTIVRRFFDVPRGATWVTVSLRAHEFASTSSRLFFFQCMQLNPQRRYNDRAHERVLRFESGSLQQASFKVVEGRTIELVLAQFWSSLGDTHVDLDVEFAGFAVDDSSRVLLSGGERVRAIEVTNWLAPRAVAPKGSLEWLQKALAPKSSLVRSLGPCDRINGVQVHALELTYELKLAKATEVAARLPLACDNLYEGAFVGQMALYYDERNKPLGARDAWPSALRLPAGLVRIAVQLRHTSSALLSGLASVPLMAHIKLASAVSVDAYDSLNKLVNGGGKATSFMLRTGERAALFLAAPDASAGVSDGAVAGDVLIGSLALLDPPAKVTSSSPKMREPLQLHYIVPPAALAAAAPSASAPASTTSVPPPLKSVAERIADGARDAALGVLASLPLDSADYLALFAELSGAHANHLPLFVGHLERLDAKVPLALRTGDQLEAVIAAADAVLALISRDQVALALGKPQLAADAPAEAVAARAEALANKGRLADALIRRAAACLAAVRVGGLLARADAAYAEASEWADSSNKSFSALTTQWDAAHGRTAKALGDARKAYAAATDAASRASALTLVVSLLNELGWACWASHVSEVARAATRTSAPEFF